MAVLGEVELRRRGIRRRNLRKLGVLTWVALITLSILVLLAVFGSLLPLGDPTATGVGQRLSEPSGAFPAGTDGVGRSVLPRLVQGLRTTFLVAAIAVAVTASFSVVMAMAAAYYGGIFGNVTVRLADILFSFPSLLLAILIAAITGPGLLGAVIAIVLICAPLMVRTVRAASLVVVNHEFVVAARVGGARGPRVLFVHVLPNIAGAAVVQATYCLSVGMLIESGLSFLGLGVQPPRASLGSLVHEGVLYLSIAPWLVLSPGALLALAILAVNLLGDGLRDLLDVRSAEVRR